MYSPTQLPLNQIPKMTMITSLSFKRKRAVKEMTEREILATLTKRSQNIFLLQIYKNIHKAEAQLASDQ